MTGGASGAAHPPGDSAPGAPAPRAARLGALEAQPFGVLLRRRRRARRLTQVALGLRVSIDHSAISRFETGAALPSAADFDALCRALRVDAADREELTRALQRDTLRRHDLPRPLLLTGAELLAQAGEWLSAVRALRQAGQPHAAARTAAGQARWLRAVAGEAVGERVRIAVLRGLADLLMEECKAYLDYVVPQEAWSYTGPVIADLKRIAADVGDPSLRVVADVGEEGALYVSGAYEDAHLICRRILDERRPGGAWEGEVLRAAAINSGYLRDETELRRVDRRIRLALDRGEGDPLTDAFLLEGLGRGQAFLGLPAALETLDEAQRLQDESRRHNTYSGLRAVQLIRTRLRALQALGVTDKTETERLAQRGLLLCEELGYHRYKLEIEQLLRAALDGLPRPA
jgi:transcriptional regulator with XRE-family HTH domain